MKNVILFNIGNRDLKFNKQVMVNGKEINDYLPKNNGEDFRGYSQYVLNHYEDFASVIHFPLIEETLKYVVSTRRNKIDEIFLFASDQSESSPFHITDTINVAKLFKRYFQSLKQDHFWKAKLEETKNPKIKLVKKNPSDLDMMKHVYDNYFSSLSEEKDGINRVFISMTGGAPAMNTMALLNGVKYLQDKADIIYLPNNQTSPRVLNVGRRMALENYIRTVEENINVYEYYGSIRFLENNTNKFSNRSVKRLVIALLRYAHNRISFNFEQAVKDITDIENEEAAIEIIDEISQLKGALYNLCYNESETDHMMDYMLELYWNTYIFFKKGQFIDVCGRVFRYQEQALNYLITEKLSVKLARDQKSIDPKWMEGQAKLRMFLNKKDINWNRGLTRPLMERIVEFYISDRDENLQETLTLIKSFNPLADVRNQSPMAHGFKGVSLERMFEATKKEWGIKDITMFNEHLFKNMHGIYQSLFDNEEPFKDNIYDTINDLLFRQLKRLV